MNAREQIDEYIAAAGDWRGDLLTEARRLILDVDPTIEEAFKYMGSPVWEKGSIFLTGNIFAKKVKLGFMHGASLEDPKGLFNGELGGKQRRSYELYEGDTIDAEGFQDLVRAAIARHTARKAR